MADLTKNIDVKIKRVHSEKAKRKNAASERERQKIMKEKLAEAGNKVKPLDIKLLSRES